MTEPVTHLLVKRGELRTRHFTCLPARQLLDGEALLRVEAVALTANTVTYAAFGEAMHYWDFFPAPESEGPGWGRVPAWGFCTVAGSRAAGLEVGARHFGFLPIASHLIVRPRARSRGFADASPHRQHLPAAYNIYSKAAASDPDSEAMAMLFRPLFGTAYVLDDYLAENAWFGAQTIAISSASSKTGSALAFMLKRRRGLRVIGLSSPRNLGFVSGTGCFDRVLPYVEVDQLDATAAVLYVDLAGSNALRRKLHEHLRERLVHDCTVGATHGYEPGGPDLGLPGVAPQFFFMPTQFAKRAAELGQENLESEIEAAATEFRAAARPWFKIHRERGEGAVDRAWIDVVEGRTAAEDGVILSL
jgi:hypothetical protein